MASPDAAGGPDGDAGAPPSWLSLEPGETLRWQGGPRVQTVVPSVVVGLALVGGGLAALAGLLPRPLSGPGAAVAALAGLAIPVGSYLRVSNTDYVVTDRGLYRKRGVLSRSVLAVDYETVQNASYSRGVTGALFGYGTLSFDTAGGAGTELSFRNLDDPTAVQALVEDRLARVRRGGRGGQPGPGGSGSGVPGSTEQWEAVLEEVRALRRAVESEQ